jgi:DNA-binding NtrC family response regulator
MLPRVLILSGEPEHQHRLSSLIPNCGYVPVCCETISAAKGMISRYATEIVVCDETLPDGDFRQLIKELKHSTCEALVVVMSQSYSDWGAYLEAMVAGAYDFLAYPPDPSQLEQALAGALVESKARLKVVTQTAA